MGQVVQATQPPCLALLSPTEPNLTERRRTVPIPALQCNTTRRRVVLDQPSQHNSRQLGGMIPSRRAAAIMPRCLWSSRKT